MGTSFATQLHSMAVDVESIAPGSGARKKKSAQINHMILCEPKFGRCVSEYRSAETKSYWPWSMHRQMSYESTTTTHQDETQTFHSLTHPAIYRAPFASNFLRKFFSSLAPVPGRTRIVNTMLVKNIRVAGSRNELRLKRRQKRIQIYIDDKAKH